MSRSTVDNLCIAFFLFLVFFIPQSNVFTRLYFAILLLSVPLLLGTKKLYLDWLSKIGIGILIVSVISIVLRFSFIIRPNIRDYTEFARVLLPVLMLIFRDKFKNLTVKTLFVVFAIYCSADFLVSILDFSGLNILGIVTFTQEFYVSGGHTAKWYRIAGLSPGPGQHGVVMLVLYIFFYIRAFQSKRILLPIFFSTVAAVSLFLSQSRTAIIACGLVSVCVPIFYLIFGHRREKRRSVPILTVIVGGGAFIFTQFITYFSRVMSLLNGIAQVSSFQERQTFHATLLAKAMQHPLFLAIGYGKEFFKTSVFDNEYLLMFLVHGPIFTIIIIGGVLAYLITFLLKEKKVEYKFGIILSVLLSAGLVVAYPSSFFLQFSLIPVTLIFVNITYWENKITNKSTSDFSLKLSSNQL